MPNYQLTWQTTREAATPQEAAQEAIEDFFGTAADDDKCWILPGDIDCHVIDMETGEIIDIAAFKGEQVDMSSSLPIQELPEFLKPYREALLKAAQRLVVRSIAGSNGTPIADDLDASEELPHA